MKKMIRGGALTAALAVVVALCSSPTAAYAAPQEFDISTGELTLKEEKGGCPGHVVTGATSSHSINVESGTHNITLKNCTIDLKGSDSLDYGALRVRNSSKVNLTLEGANKMVGGVNHAGVAVNPNASLIIGGSGSLEAQGSSGSIDTGSESGAAGIGGNALEDFGSVTINGGTVRATGISGGAGIGAGYDFTYAPKYGTSHGSVTVTGGNVVAIAEGSGHGGNEGAATYAAAIGAGAHADYAGTVTISGGTVVALNGQDNEPAIGKGGDSKGSSSGTFTTGENGNAVVVSRGPIGDTSHAKAWDGIFLRDVNAAEGDATCDGSGAVTLSRGKFLVYGEPALDYNLAVSGTASLVVTGAGEDGSDPATLTMGKGVTLTNNVKPEGIVLQPGSKLRLEGGVEQCAGEGEMRTYGEDAQLGKGVVQVPLTEGLCTLNPESFVYDGKEKKPAVTVKFNKWNFEQTFAEGAEKDYTVSYENNVNVTNEAKATATSTGKGNLFADTSCTQTFEIKKVSFNVDVPETWTVKVGENQLLSKLPKASFPANAPEDFKQGTLSWYDETIEPLTDTSVADKTAGERVTVSWVYKPADTSKYADVSGSTTLIMSELDVYNAGIFKDGEKVDSLGMTYGDEGISLEAGLERDGSYGTPDSVVTWESSDDSVVSVDGSGNVTVKGAGEAKVTATIAEHSAEDPESSYAQVKAVVSITVAPKPIMVDLDSLKATDRTYDGTREIEVAAELTEGALVPGDEGHVLLVATGTVDSPSAAQGKTVNVSFELSGEKAKDYELSPSTATTTVNIDRADPDGIVEVKQGEMSIYNKIGRTYSFSLNTIRPVVSGSGAISNVDWSVADVKLSDGRYFSKDDVHIDNITKVMTIDVTGVDSKDEGELGTIELTLTTPNYTDMTTTVALSRTNPSEDETVTVTATAGEGGTIEPSGVNLHLVGDTVTYTVTPDKGYRIKDVVVDGESKGATTGVVFKEINADHTIEATFEKGDSSGTGSTVEVDSNGKGDGSGNETLPSTGDYMPMIADGIVVVAAALVGTGVVLRRRSR